MGLPIVASASVVPFSSSPLLTQSQEWLEQARTDLDNVVILGEMLEIQKPTTLSPDMAMTYEAMLLAVPSAEEQKISEAEQMAWGRVWFEAASMLHVTGRRLLDEGFHRLSMEMLLRSLVQFYGWDGDDKENRAAAVRADMARIPPVYKTDEPTRSPDRILERWSLQEALRNYFATFGKPEAEEGRLDEEEPLPVTDPSKIPTVEIKDGPFESEWKAMTTLRRVALRAAMDRVYKIYSPSTITLLDTIVRFSRAHFQPTEKIHDFLGRAIRALDIMLANDKKIIILKMSIDGFNFPNVGAVRPSLLSEWEGEMPLPSGVKIFY